VTGSFKVVVFWIFSVFFIPFIGTPSDAFSQTDSLPTQNETGISVPDFLSELNQENGAESETVKTAIEGIKLAKKAYKPALEFSNVQDAVMRVEGFSIEDATTFSAEVWELFTDLRAHVKAEQKRLDPHEFDLQLNEGKIKLSKHKFGRAELNRMDGEIYYRILHKDSEISFRFLNVDKVEPESLHNHRIIASQHIAGGKSRTDGQRGRDDMEIYYKVGENDEVTGITHVRFFPRHHIWSKEWWRDQVLATFYWPTLPELLISGGFWGAYQLGLVYGVGSLENALYHHASSTNLKQSIFTGCFGFACGATTRSLRKFTQVGSDTEMIIRNILSTGLPFVVPFIMLDPHRGPEAFLEARTWVMDLAVFFIINNLTKIEIQKFNKRRVDERLNTNENDKFLGVKRQDWENQGTYNFLNMPLRIFNLTNALKVKLEMLGAPVVIQGGKVLFLMAYIPFKYGNVAYAEYLKSDDALKTRLSWEKSIWALAAGVPFGTALDLSRYIYVRTAGRSRDPENHLQRLAARWNRQKHALAFHVGRVVGLFSDLTDPETKEKLPKSQRFNRVAPTWEESNPQNPAWISRATSLVKNGMSNSFGTIKLNANRLTNGRFARCSNLLEGLGNSLKRPFEAKLNQLAENYPD
jgi:hypothetical protein